MNNPWIFIGLMIALIFCIYLMYWSRKQEKQDWTMRMMEKKMDYSYDLLKNQPHDQLEHSEQNEEEMIEEPKRWLRWIH